MKPYINHCEAGQWRPTFSLYSGLKLLLSNTSAPFCCGKTVYSLGFNPTLGDYCKKNRLLISCVVTRAAGGLPSMPPVSGLQDFPDPATAPNDPDHAAWPAL